MKVSLSDREQANANQYANSLEYPFCSKERPAKSACAFFTEVNNSNKAAQAQKREQMYEESIAIINPPTQSSIKETSGYRYKTTFPSLKRSLTSISETKAGTSTEIELTNSFEDLVEVIGEAENISQPNCSTPALRKSCVTNPWARPKGGHSRRSRSRSIQTKKTDTVQQKSSITQNSMSATVPPGFRKEDNNAQNIIESICRKLQLSKSTTHLILLIFAFIASLFPKITSLLELLSPLLIQYNE